MQCSLSRFLTPCCGFLFLGFCGIIASEVEAPAAERPSEVGQTGPKVSLVAGTVSLVAGTAQPASSGTASPLRVAPRSPLRVAPRSPLQSSPHHGFGSRSRGVRGRSVRCTRSWKFAVRRGICFRGRYSARWPPRRARASFCGRCETWCSSSHGCRQGPRFLTSCLPGNRPRRSRSSGNRWHLGAHQGRSYGPYGGPVGTWIARPTPWKPRNNMTSRIGYAVCPSS